MAGIERDAQSGQRLVRFRRRQGIGRSPESRSACLRIRIGRELESENIVRFAIGQNLRGVVVDLDQVVGDSVRAIDVVDQMGEFVMGNRVLIMFQHTPRRFASENAEIVGATNATGKDRQTD